jgi:hypothetical protein
MTLRSAVAILFCSLLSARAGAAVEIIAKGFSADRYQGLWERNPFEWVAAPTATANPNFAEKLVLTSWLNQGNKEVVFVKNTETQESEKVTTEPNANQVRIVSIRGDLDPKKVQVVLSNGKEEGTVKFNTEPPKEAEAAKPSIQPGGPQVSRSQPGGGQQNSARGADNSHKYTMPPGMNQYNQRHYGAYIQQQQDLKKQQQQIQQQQQQYQQPAQQ